MILRLSVIASVFSLLASGSALAADSPREQAKALFAAIPAAPPGPPAAPEMVSLGKMLFFEPRLSEAVDMSCSTCHNLSMGGVDGRAQSIGHSGQLGGRKVLTVLNAVFNVAQYWDGRAVDLKDQVVNSVMANPKALLRSRGGPMAINPTDLATARQRAVERLKGVPGYAGLFGKAFPGEADPINYDNVGRAIAAFEATLTTPGAPFDRWLAGDESALNEAQKQGLALFVGAGCAGCHNGVNIGGGGYARFGAVQAPPADLLPPDDWGRFAVTKAVADKYAFKIPSLRNIERTAPYFHSGAVWDLNKAIAVMGETQLGKKLSDEEIGKIAAFLGSLSGRQPEVVLPVLPPPGPATPRPAQ